jgi:eukaryotic translation initiation factor 2C
MDEFHQALGTIGVNADAPIAGQRLLMQHPDKASLGPFFERASAGLSLLFIIRPENA